MHVISVLLEYLQVFRMYSFRMDDDEVERFGVAANGDMSKFVATMKKTVQWRENYHFLPESDLQTWSHLIFWHLHDAQGRPILVIRLGAAYSSIAPSDRPRFAQAVGMHNYLLSDSISLLSCITNFQRQNYHLRTIYCCCNNIIDSFLMS